MAVNPNKPLRLVGVDWKTTLVGLLPNGDIVVHVETWPLPATFNPETGKGRTGWTSYTLENAPELRSAFHWWDAQTGGTRGRGMTMLFSVWSDYPTAEYCLEVEYTDGIPTGAKFHERKC